MAEVMEDYFLRWQFDGFYFREKITSGNIIQKHAKFA